MLTSELKPKYFLSPLFLVIICSSFMEVKLNISFFERTDFAFFDEKVSSTKKYLYSPSSSSYLLEMTDSNLLIVWLPFFSS